MSESRFHPLSPTKSVADHPFNKSSGDPYFIWECSVLSAHVYDGNVALPPGWSLVPNSQTSILDYYSACYMKYGMNSGHPVIVFAHRGTNNLGNLIHDINLILGFKPAHIDEIYKAQLMILKGLGVWDDSGYLDKDAWIGQTAHSLGSIYADILNCMSNLNANGKSITFENPGSWDSLAPTLISYGATPENLALYRTWCFAYQADVNAINTCRPQTGTTFRVMGIPYDYDPKLTWLRAPWELNEPNPLSNLYYLKYTLQQHSIVQLSEILNKNKIVKACKNPSDLVNGYKAYINYDQRQDYWDGYFEYFWNHDSEVHKRFKSYEDFCKYSISIMRSFTDVTNQHEAKKILGNDSRLFSSREENQNNNNIKRSLNIEDFEIINPNDDVVIEYPKSYKEMFMTALGLKR